MNERQDPDRADHTADDDAWRDLVSRLRGGAAGDDGSGPAPTELSAAQRAAGPAPGHRPATPAGPTPQGTPEGSSASGRDFSAFDPLGLSEPRRPAPGRGAAGEESDALPGDFVPDDPDPVLAGADPVVVLAWCGALGGPLALLICALVWRSVPGYVIFLLVAAFVSGVGTLIMRLPRHKEDDGDDGARV